MDEENTARLRKEDWCVRTVPLSICQQMVEQYHYSRGGSNTATYRHGLFKQKDPHTCYGVAWWIPPTKAAALATYPARWQGVLCLSRMAIRPDAPRNAASFLLARSRKLIDREAWPCLVTYADEGQGHTGAIYRADNWHYAGCTKPERRYSIAGRMVNRKAGPRTYTHAEMLERGAILEGAHAKHKFVNYPPASQRKGLYSDLLS